MLSSALDMVKGEYALRCSLDVNPANHKSTKYKDRSMKSALTGRTNGGAGIWAGDTVPQPHSARHGHSGRSWCARCALVGTGHAIMEAGRTRHVAVRVAFSDDRTDESLRKEAKSCRRMLP